jgi:hypothetical protein
VTALDEPAPEEPLRPDAGRTVTRLQMLIGQQAGQIVQLEDVIEQLQERVAALTVDLARARNPAPPATEASA